MPLRADLELAAITLPLDIVLELATAAKAIKKAIEDDRRSRKRRAA